MAVCLVLFEWHRQSCSHFSDSLDFLLLALALILALQIRDGRPAAWRIPLLALTCAAMVVARYSGALMLPMVLGTILGGELRPRLNRQWLAAAVVVLVMTGAFFGTRSLLHSYADEQMQATASPEERAAIMAALKSDDTREERSFLLYPRASAGTWLVTLFWPPATVLEPMPLVRHLIEVGRLGSASASSGEGLARAASAPVAVGRDRHRYLHPDRQASEPHRAAIPGADGPAHRPGDLGRRGVPCAAVAASVAEEDCQGRAGGPHGIGPGRQCRYPVGQRVGRAVARVP